MSVIAGWALSVLLFVRQRVMLLLLLQEGKKRDNDRANLFVYLQELLDDVSMAAVLDKGLDCVQRRSHACHLLAAFVTILRS